MQEIPLRETGVKMLRGSPLENNVSYMYFRAVFLMNSKGSRIKTPRWFTSGVIIKDIIILSYEIIKKAGRRENVWNYYIGFEISCERSTEVK